MRHKYLEKVYYQLMMFVTYTFMQIPQVENIHSDALVSLASTLNHQLRHFIPDKYLYEQSIYTKLAVEVAWINIIPSWQDPITNYPVIEALLNDRLE